MKKISAFLILFSLSACSIPITPTGDYAKTVVSPNFRRSKKSVAVLPFLTPQGQIDVTASDIASVELMKMGFKIVDRSQTEAIFQELKLSMTGAISPNELKEVGHLLSVDMIVTGTEQFKYVPARANVDVYGGNYREGYVKLSGVAIRMIDIESGEVLVSSFCCDENIQSSDIPKEISLSIAKSISENELTKIDNLGIRKR